MDTATALVSYLIHASGRSGVLLAIVAVAVLVILATLVVTALAQPASEALLASPFRWSWRA